MNIPLCFISKTSKPLAQLLSYRQAWLQVLQMSTQNISEWRDFDSDAKCARIQALARQANAKFNKLRDLQTEWQKHSWWREVLFGDERTERQYLLLQNKLLSLIAQCHRSLDSIKFHFQAYLAELFECEKQKSAFEFFLLLCPPGPIKQYYQGLALLRQYELTCLDDRKQAIDQLQRAKALILESQKPQLTMVNQQDADFCRALYYSDLNAKFDESEGDETLSRVAARRIFYTLSQQHYVPAMHELARFRLSSKSRGQLPLRTAHAMDLCMNAADGGYVPAMVTAASLYWRYLRSEWVASTEGTWPPLVRDKLFAKKASGMLLDAYFLHDDNRARDILADIIELVEGAVAPLDASKEAVLHKCQVIYRHYQARKETLMGFSSKSAFNLSHLNGPKAPKPQTEPVMFRFLSNYCQNLSNQMRNRYSAANLGRRHQLQAT